MTNDKTTFWHRAGKGVLALLILTALGLFLTGCDDHHLHFHDEYQGVSNPR